MVILKPIEINDVSIFFLNSLVSVLVLTKKIKHKSLIKKRSINLFFSPPQNNLAKNWIYYSVNLVTNNNFEMSSKK